MAFRSPPTHELREEWRRINHEVRRKLVALAIDAWQPSAETDLREKLASHGLSSPMVTWLIDEAERFHGEISQEMLESRRRVAMPKLPVDRFNTALGPTITLMVGLIWLRQEFILFSHTSFPIGFFIALILNFVVGMITLTAWRKWLRTIRRRD